MQGINNYQQPFGTNRLVVGSNLRDFKPEVAKEAEEAIKEIANTFGGDNIFLMDKAFVLDEFPIQSKKEPKTFIQKVLSAFGWKSVEGKALTGNPTKEEIKTAALEMFQKIN